MSDRKITKKSASVVNLQPVPVSTTTKVVIAPPNFQSAVARIIGITPYCMNMMSSTNREAIMKKQMEGSRSKKGTLRAPKDFDAIYRGSQHISVTDENGNGGWYGIPASAFRAGMISACRTVGFQMTKGKLGLFIVADGIDRSDGQMLVKLEGEPVRRDMAVKLADGSTDILARAFFDKWAANVHVEWDADMFSAHDIINLLSRMGRQVGIGAGRHDSKNSCGMGWGVFKVEGTSET